MRRLRRHVDNRLMRRVRRDDAVCGQGLAADRNRRTHPGFTPALAYAYLTQIYDIVQELLGFGRSFKTRIARQAAPAPGEAVLDLGCGTGILLRAHAPPAERSLHRRRSGPPGPGRGPSAVGQAAVTGRVRARLRAGAAIPGRILRPGREHADVPPPARRGEGSCDVGSPAGDDTPWTPSAGGLRRAAQPRGRGPPQDRQHLRWAGEYASQSGRELSALLASTGFTVQEVARPHRSVLYLLATAGGEGCPDVGGGPGTGGHCSLVVGRFASGSFVP